MTETSKKRGERIFREFLGSYYWDSWRANHLGNDLFISDPERADRIHEAAEHGCDGSTHGEIIDDCRAAWRDYLRDRCGSELDRVDSAVQAYLDNLEVWHEENGSLDEQVG